MKHILISASVCIGWIAIIYFTVSFFYLTTNPVKWGQEGRLNFICGGVILGLLIGIFHYGFNEEKPK